MAMNTPLADKRILIVEDSAIAMQNVLKPLQEKKAAVEYYENLPRIENLINGNFDLAILDLLIEKETSIDLIHELKQTFPAIRIIVITSNRDILDDEPEVFHQIDFLLEKPFTPEQIIEAASEALYLPLKGKKFLIVEDARVSLITARNILKNLGGYVDAYRDLVYRDEMLSKQYDVAICDILLRQGDTIDFIKDLKLKYPETGMIITSAMPSYLEKHPEIFSNIDFILSKPFEEHRLKETVIQLVEQPFSDRRRQVRKSGFPFCWVAPYYADRDKSDMFESPNILNISNEGLSFQTHLEYTIDSQVTIWVLNNEDDSKNILEIRGLIKWSQKPESATEDEEGQTQYGVQFTPDATEDFNAFQKFIATLLNL